MALYQRTHPWLTFKLDLTGSRWSVPTALWLLAGEAVSKCDHLAGVALSPSAAKELMKLYLAKGALATTAIEGNTLSESDARKRVDGIKDLPPSKAYLGVEIDNIIKASEEVLSECRRGNKPSLDINLIKRFNASVLAGLEVASDVFPGELRLHSVGVADYRGAPASECNELLQRLCDWLQQDWVAGLNDYPNEDQKRFDAILKAIVAHIYIAWIHPFGDGNGRTARLLEFFILATSGVPFPATQLLSNHYNETRSDYYRQLSTASKSGGNITPFIVYALRGFVDQLRSQIAIVRDEQLSLFWRDYVHSELGDSKTGRRRRYLVEDLTKLTDGASRSSLSEISVRVLKHYVGKGDKTLQRDVAELERLRLLRHVGDRYFANRDLVRAYMPPASRS